MKPDFRLWLFVGGLSALALSAANASSSSAAPNLLANPGFENSADGIAPWNGRNWWKKEVKLPGGGVKTITNAFQVAIDRNNPHSGRQCLKVVMSDHQGGTLQLLQSHLQVKPGMSVRLRFWARGPSNSLPVNVQFRKDMPPWTKFFNAEVPLADEWREHVFNFTFPAKNAVENCSLMFQLKQANTFWLDDVSITELPVTEPGPVPAGNRIGNGSFEVGRDRWYASFRESRADFSPEADESNAAAELRSIRVDDAPDGGRALAFEVFPKCRVELTSAFFPLKYGHETTIEFYAKALAAKKPNLDVSLLCGEFPNEVRERKIFNYAGTGWQKMSFKVIPKPSSSGTYSLCFNITTPGKYWLDGITVRQSSAANGVTRPTPDVGWEPVDGKHPANFYQKGEVPEFRILVNAKPGTATLTLPGTVVDAWERMIARLEVKVPVGADGHGEAILRLPVCDRYGVFKVSLGGVEAADPAVEILYSVPHELPPPGKVADSFFGGHVNYSPYNLLLAEKAGFRWLRLHPPNHTKWCFIETKKGELVFPISGVARAHAKGFKLLGNLGTVPEFYADKPAKERQTWYYAFPPKGEEGWKAYENYVAATVKAFAPYTRTWEIGNESDGQFLQVPEGQNREEIYLEYVRRTVSALQGAKDVTLIGGVITGGDRPFMGKILGMGIGRYVDAMSFHHYNGIFADTIGKRETEIKFWGSFKNRDGAPMPLWHTEGYAGFGWESPTWMKSTGVDFPYLNRQWMTAGMTVRSAVCFRALGVKKHFIYAAYANSTGRIVYRNECSFMADVNGLPLPALAAHAAAVHFLEEVEPLGLDFVPSRKYGRASFLRHGRKLDVLWSDREIDVDDDDVLKTLVAGRLVFDMMGNPINSKVKLRLTAAPIYVLEK